MHSLFGYSWGEIASILAAISTTLGGVYWIIRQASRKLNNTISNGTFPLQQQLKDLNTTHKHDSEEHDESIKELKGEVSKQHDELIEHEQRIEHLEDDKK